MIIGYYLEFCELRGNKGFNKDIEYRLLCFFVWFIYNYGWNKEACLFIGEGGVVGKGGRASSLIFGSNRGIFFFKDFIGRNFDMYKVRT